MTRALSDASLPRLEHDTTADFACWCHPDIFVACACGAGRASGPGCAECAGTGMRRVTPELAPLAPGARLIVHRGPPLVVQ